VLCWERGHPCPLGVLKHAQLFALSRSGGL
jgi:hypothetical protein